MDNPGSESTGSLDTNEAGALFSSLMSGESLEKETPDTPEEAAEKLVIEESGSEEDQPEEVVSERIPVEVDGKVVELTKAEIADAYKNGLRQADYTKKTMEAADARKTAEAESTAARTERQEYAQKLNVYAVQLQGALQEQSQINWQQLLDSDPVEYLKQERIFNQRQAALQQAQQEQGRIYQQQQAEQAESVKTFLSNQQQELLAKLPEWKNADKQKADITAIKEYLVSMGFDAAELNNVVDHRNVLAYRKAMMYDALIARASAATKKVATLPAKVERPGTAAVASDGRGDAMKRLAKSGSVDDAAALFSRMF